MDLSDAFLRDIFDHPDDAVLRLIYADWLTERDDPRGEVIRLHCRRLEVARKDELQTAVLRVREQELWAGHSVEWVEQASVPLTWDEAIGLFRRRLSETAAWCAARPDCLRSPELEPASASAGRLFNVLCDDPQPVVARLAALRAAHLPAPIGPVEEIRDGRLLAFMPEGSLSDEAAEMDAPAFFDCHNIPAWDTWVWCLNPASPSIPHWDGYSILLAWVPESRIAQVDRAIQVNPEQCIDWATSLSGPRIQRLLAGLAR